MIGDLLAQIIRELEKQSTEETENLVLTPKTLDEYLRIVGRVQGLRLAVDIIREQYSEYVNGPSDA